MILYFNTESQPLSPYICPKRSAVTGSSAALINFNSAAI